ncbi:MAG TPA: prepilin-type N-terminal cleavage/methylation domain-containing protein [Pirellulales bacterium]|nr:prepilin-type N-terminal cleavage/methylation domain-containing protein [Pirellulales bacterium]
MAKRSGFTLLELMLVLALLAAIAALIWPALARPLASQRLRRAAEQVRMHLTKTRTKAIMSGETLAFSFQSGKRLMRVQTVTQNEAVLESSSTASATGGSGGAMSMPASGATMASSNAAVTVAEDQLPDGIIFYGGDVASDARSDHVAAQERMKGSIDLSWSQPVQFFPDGTALAARVAVAGDRGRAIVIEVRSLTGAVKISDIVSVETLRQ